MYSYRWFAARESSPPWLQMHLLSMCIGTSAASEPHTHTGRTRWSVSTTSICQSQYHISAIITNINDWTAFSWFKSMWESRHKGWGAAETKESDLRAMPRRSQIHDMIPSKCFALSLLSLKWCEREADGDEADESAMVGWVISHWWAVERE